MKRRKAHAAFIEQLQESISSLKHMKPDEMHVITVHANYGNYEIVIGPELKNAPEGKHLRPIEINGEIHHLFISPEAIAPNPSKRQVDDKLKHTVIMQDLSVHLRDAKGDGRHASGRNGSGAGVLPRGMINMAGAEGEALLDKVAASNKLNDITYKIIQNDILQALHKRRREKSLQM